MFVTQIKDQDIDIYLSERKELFFQRIRIALLLGIGLVPFFSVLDYYVSYEHFWLFFVYRVGCSSALLALLVFHRTGLSERSYLWTGAFECILICLTISLMILKLGGYDSFYYTGIILVVVSYSALVPLTPGQSGGVSLIFYLVYSVPLLLFSDRSPESMTIFFSNSFFFATFVIIGMVICNESTKSRKKEFNMRVKLNEHAEQLEYYANNLEKEVEKRAKKLEDSELRYRELYDQVIDQIVLIGENGAVKMANPAFYKDLDIQKDTRNTLFFEQFVVPEDLPFVKKELFQTLLKKAEVSSLDFRLRSMSGKIFSVECSGTTVWRNRVLEGFQIVIRDVSLRKKLESKLISSYQSLVKAKAATILGLARLAEYRDLSTGKHLERMREYSRVIVEHLARQKKYRNYITPQYIDDLYQSAILHDIGKVGVSDTILLKPGSLTSEEFDLIKLHTVYGRDILKEVVSDVKGQSFLSMGEKIAYSHHEKWDGSGYPRGLKGRQIPLSARCVAVADVYDALTSSRIYKPPFSHEKARDLIVDQKGRHFDPDVVESFLCCEEKFKAILESFRSAEAGGAVKQPVL